MVGRQPLRRCGFDESLVNTFAVATIEGFCLTHKIYVEINIYTSTSMFNQIWARPPGTTVAKMASIVGDGSQ